MFFKVIAVIFLVLFLIKIFNPKLFPFVKKGFQVIFDFITYTFNLFIKSSLYTFHLLFTRTVYVIGLDILIALFLNILITFISYPHINIHIWFTIFKNNLFNVYVFTFFIFTYVIGLFEYLRVKKNLKLKFMDFLNQKFTKKRIKSGHYTYDEKTKEYHFHDA